MGCASCRATVAGRGDVAELRTPRYNLAHVRLAPRRSELARARPDAPRAQARRPRLASRPARGLRLARRRRGGGSRPRGPCALHDRERPRPARLPQPAAHGGRPRRDRARPLGRRRGDRRPPNVRRHREHLPRHPRGPGVGAATAPGGHRARDRGRVVGASRGEQGGPLPRHDGAPRAGRSRLPRRRGRDGRRDHPAHRHALWLGAHLLARRHRSHRGAGRSRAGARALAARRRLRGRHPRPVRPGARSPGAGVRPGAARRDVGVRRSPQVGLCGQGRLGGPLPDRGAPGGGALRLRRLAHRALQRQHLHRHPPRRRHRGGVGGDAFPGRDGIPPHRGHRHGGEGAPRRRPRPYRRGCTSGASPSSGRWASAARPTTSSPSPIG